MGPSSGFRDVSGAGRGFSLTFLGNIPSITPFADRCSMAAARVRCDLREWPSPRHRAERTAREETRDDGIAHHVRERRIGRG